MPVDKWWRHGFQREEIKPEFFRGPQIRTLPLLAFLELWSSPLRSRVPGVGAAERSAFGGGGVGGVAVSQGSSENFHVFFWALCEQPWKPLGLIS